jgi:hypothetical protein
MKRFLLLALFVAACSNDDDDREPEPEPEPESETETPTAGATAPLERAVALSSSLLSDGTAGASLGIQAARVASIQSNGGSALVTTGTVTESASGATYSPMPADKLVVKRADGSTVELVITEMQGDLTGDADDFFHSNHELRLTMRNGETDLDLLSSRGNGQTYLAVAGFYASGGVRYTVDVVTQGTYYFESSFGSVESNEDTTTDGYLEAEGFRINLDEAWHYKFISVSGSSVSDSQKIMNHELLTGGHRYKWQNAAIKKVFRDGKPSSLSDYWGSSGGALLMDGAAWGELRFVPGSPKHQFLLVTPAGQIVLESWNSY